jgi:hypothetical protein
MPIPMNQGEYLTQPKPYSKAPLADFPQATAGASGHVAINSLLRPQPARVTRACLPIPYPLRLSSNRALSIVLSRKVDCACQLAPCPLLAMLLRRAPKEPLLRTTRKNGNKSSTLLLSWFRWLLIAARGRSRAREQGSEMWTPAYWYGEFYCFLS